MFFRSGNKSCCYQRGTSELKTRKETSIITQNYIRHLRLYSSTVPKQRPRPTQMSSIAPKFLFHGLVDIVKRFVILKFQEGFAHCEEPTWANKKKRKGPEVWSICCFSKCDLPIRKKWIKQFLSRIFHDLLLDHDGIFFNRGLGTSCIHTTLLG